MVGGYRSTVGKNMRGSESERPGFEPVLTWTGGRSSSKLFPSLLNGVNAILASVYYANDVFHLAKPLADITPKVVAREFLQVTAPNHPEMGPVGFPNKQRSTRQ